MKTRCPRTVARALVLTAAVLTCTLPARAQITTGSVAGTVRDAQGGVIPGATVTLVREDQGTRSAPVVTSATHFRGSLYDVERNSDWNSNSKVNKLNGDPKPIAKERDWGFSIGGPVGKPGGDNKVFFFYAHEFQPRTAGNNVVRYRMPTALERQGDFSQSTDNNGNLYPFIKDPLLPGACNATTQAGCFADGGVLGRIPADRLYQTGLNILNQWPQPNLATAPGQAYNFELTRPAESVLSWQPAVRLDYQPTQKLRASFKYSGWQQRNQTINGTLPGFNDTKMQRPVVSSWVATVSYMFNPTTFLEMTYGAARTSWQAAPLPRHPPGRTSVHRRFRWGLRPIDEGRG